MDQKEIDELLKTGAFNDFNQKQEELIRNISEKAHKPAPSTASPPPQKNSSRFDDEDVPPRPRDKEGRVMGQLSRVTEESEAGTNMVMEFMESILNTISKQKEFITDIKTKYRESPEAINFDEVLTFVNDSLFLVEEKIFSAMDAFQFQDIGRQKLMKVMYTLARLNEYLNELLGGSDIERTKQFGSKIEEKTMEQDKEKHKVDKIVANFHNTGEPTPPSQPKPTQPASNQNPVVDVDKIIAEFQKAK
jgi:arginine deiminase